MINLFNKTDDFIKMINLFNKTNDLIKKYLVKQVLASPDMTEVRVLVQFGTFRVPKWYFNEMT